MPDETPSTAQPTRKPSWQYWMPRLLVSYVAAGFVLFVVGAILGWKYARWMTPFGVVWVLIFVGSYSMLVNPFVFPFKYSMFGPYRRTPLTTTRSIWSGTSRGAVGSVRIAGSFGSPGSFARGSWRVHPSGIVVTVDWVGTGFVHRDHFVSLTETHGGRWVLEHASPEMASPIAFYNKDLAAAVNSIMPPR